MGITTERRTETMMAPRNSLCAALILMLTLAGCTNDSQPTVAVDQTTPGIQASESAAPTATSPTATTTTTVVPATITTTTTTTTTTATTLPGRPTETSLATFGIAGDVTLHHPAHSVAIIGFHESSHDGSQQIDLDPIATPALTMETRDRGTGSRTAADIAVAPGSPVFSPVSGVVLRSGTYTLYCDHSDNFAVIEPDEHPGWEVKIFHIVDVQVTAGQRVEAGVTLVAPEARVLPFESQVDEFSATPPWPHVHVEVIDPSIPDRPSSGSC